MFYSTDISVTLWILNNNKKGGIKNGRKLRDRSGEILFVDLRTWNQNVYEKKFIKFTEEQIKDVCKIYFDWQSLEIKDSPAIYAKPELYYSAGFEELKEKGFSLVPSRYIEFVDRDTAMDYDLALKSAGITVGKLLKEQSENKERLIKAFKVLGYNAE